MCIILQRGGETMMQLLKTKYTSVSGQKTHVVLHAPCYSFPGYAHLLPSHSSFELYTPECFMPWY
ncbi:hypothetical protein EON65_09010 [archaeon]|nr:MAG: hypothetical protein EON65_09010 [archaeon]